MRLARPPFSWWRCRHGRAGHTHTHTHTLAQHAATTARGRRAGAREALAQRAAFLLGLVPVHVHLGAPPAARGLSNAAASRFPGGDRRWCRAVPALERASEERRAEEGELERDGEHELSRHLRGEIACAQISILNDFQAHAVKN